MVRLTKADRVDAFVSTVEGRIQALSRAHTLLSESRWQGVDLVPGDVITRVNGMPIEQPTDAHAAFESLRSADKLVVSYLRDGKERELSYSIIEKPTAGAKPAP